MGYRDDSEALRARLEQLEHENAALRRENESLRNPAIAPLLGAGGPHERLLGGPLVASVDRAIEGELPPAGHEAVLELLREAQGALGEAQVIGSTLTWRVGPPASQRALEVLVSVREGRTRVRVTERLGGLAATIFGSLVGGVGLGGSGAIFPVLEAIDPVLGLVAAPLWFFSSFAVARAAYVRGSARRASEVTALVDRLEHLVQREIARAAGPRVRVDAEEAISEELRDVAAQDRARTSRA